MNYGVKVIGVEELVYQLTVSDVTEDKMIAGEAFHATEIIQVTSVGQQIQVDDLNAMLTELQGPVG